MPSSNPVDYGADPCGLRNSAWAINLCLMKAGRCDFPEGSFLIGSTPGVKIINRSRLSNVATFNTSTPHGLVVGELITLYGFTDLTFNFNQLPPPYFNYPYPFGFRVDSVASPTQFTAVVPGADSAFVAEDGWINLVGGGYNSSIILGYAGIAPDPFTGIPFQYLLKDNIAFTGKGAGKTRVRFADHASTKRNDNFGFNIQMIKCTGDYQGTGVVGGPPANNYPGRPVDAVNCKNLKIEGITFDGNYTNNGSKDLEIVSVERTAGINTYNTSYPGLIQTTTPTSYSPPVLPAPSNQSSISQYLSLIHI